MGRPAKNTIPVPSRFNDPASVPVMVDKNVFDIYGDAASINVQLYRCVDHTDSNPIYINDANHAKIQKLLGHSIKDAEELVKILETLSRIKINGHEISLPLDVSTRLGSRASTYKIDAGKYIETEVQRNLREHVGL